MVAGRSTLTAFVPDGDMLRPLAAGARCRANTKLLDILRRVLKLDRVRAGLLSTLRPDLLV
jgi:hypothetical protein